VRATHLQFSGMQGPDPEFSVSSLPQTRFGSATGDSSRMPCPSSVATGLRHEQSLGPATDRFAESRRTLGCNPVLNVGF
jgi:hypothetical protein